MKKVFSILILIIFLLSISFVYAQDGVILTKCIDTDGDNTTSSGTTTWEYNSPLGSGGGTEEDICSTIHYTNILLNMGEKFKWGEFVLVETVCPKIGITAVEPADLPIKKFYKCECENNGKVCKGNAVEISSQRVKDAEKAWENDVQINKFSLNTFLLKFLRFFGLWG
ncbi:hypothetical protein HYU23_03480 [Candidatus Woesearchaeota archaeon]|nr:hypothetical protein [Candidatus Woesearchaeota archaeon]